MDSGKPLRRIPTRLANFDYTSSCAYFITICTHERWPLFGAVHQHLMAPTKIGSVVTECWNAIPSHFPNVTLDEFILMPNHIHGIVIIRFALVGVRHAGPLRGQRWSPPGSLGTIVRSFKSAVTKIANERRLTDGLPIWQRNYHEHVIRKHEDMNRVRQYIIDNPKNWATDQENPSPS